ncbi:MAG: nickel pincer cofactor biosynthesis protein LarB [Clostridiales bacterium]|nr:nickel pincer cofactor biosynthesis protein LarB [Clostridiales bacterium]
MEQKELLTILDQVAEGGVTPKEALQKIRVEPYKETAEGYAKIDMHRGIRQGVSEIIYGAGKTKEQILGIVQTMRSESDKAILITRMCQEAADYLSKSCPLHYDSLSKIGIVGDLSEPDGRGKIVVATGGTSDIPVAEEAALTAEFLGNKVVRLYDVGVAGIHRLMSHVDELMDATVVIAIAGMEGALASVIGGMVDCPVIAVPTSVGYGANFGGLSALLSMLNSCASGVSVVNIDNGFGAAYQASMINHIK